MNRRGGDWCRNEREARRRAAGLADALLRAAAGGSQPDLATSVLPYLALSVAIYLVQLLLPDEASTLGRTVPTER